jgi:hypothetical protein
LTVRRATNEAGGDARTRLLRAGLLTAAVDGLWACFLSVFIYESTVTRLFQGVASTLVGSDATEGGLPVAALGVLMHVGVAFGWSTVFLLLHARSARIRAAVASPSGVLGVAALFGPLVWMAMSLVVVPLLVQRPPRLGVRWWIQLAGHFPFVGLPIVAAISGRLSRRSRQGG